MVALYSLIMRVISVLVAGFFSSTYAAQWAVDDHTLSRLLQEFPSQPAPPSMFLELVDKARTSVKSSVGRRRTVWDKDCDGVEGPIDAIENICDQKRFQEFQLHSEGVMKSAIMHDSIADQMLNMNTTFAGDVFDSSDVGLREMFIRNREALYGPGGSCTDPKPNSVTSNMDKMGRTALTIAKEFEAGYDTNWRNLLTVDRRQAGRFTNATDLLADYMEFILETMNEKEEYLFRKQQKALEYMTDSQNENSLPALANKTNVMQGVVEAAADQMDNDAEKFRVEVDPKVNALLDVFDSLADNFAGTDTAFADLVKDLVFKAGPALTGAPGKAASDPVQALISSADLMTDDFKNSTLMTADGTKTDWQRTMSANQNSASVAYQDQVRHIGGALETIKSAINETDYTMEGSVTDAKNAINKNVKDLRAASRDARTVLWRMSSSVNNVKGALQDIYDALAGASGREAQELRDKVAALLSSTGDVSAQQLKGLLDNATSLQQKLGAEGLTMSSKLMGAVVKIQTVISHSGTTQSDVSSDTAGVLDAQAEVSDKLTSATADNNKAILEGSTGALMDVAEGTGAAAASASVAFADSLSTGKQDIKAALFAGSDSVSDATRAAELASAQQKLATLGNITNSAEKVDNAGLTTGKALGDARVKLGGTDSAADALSKNMEESAGHVAEKSDTMMNAVGNVDSNVADKLGAESRSVFAAAGDQATKATKGLVSDVSHAASGLGSEVDGARSQADSTLNAAKSEANSARASLSDAEGNIESLGSSVDDAVGSVYNAVKEVGKSFPQALHSTADDGRAGADYVGKGQVTQLSGIEGDGDAESSKLVGGALDVFKSKLAGIFSEGMAAASGASANGDKVKTSDIAVADGMRRVIASISSAESGLSIVQQGIDGELTKGTILEEIRTAIHKAMAAIGKNITDFENEADSNIKILPGSIPDGIDGVVKQLIDEAAHASATIAKNTAFTFDLSEGIAGSSAKDSMNILEAASDARAKWQASNDARLAALISGSKKNVDGLVGIGDGAGDIANTIALLTGLQGNAANKGQKSVSSMSGNLDDMIAGLKDAIKASQDALQRNSSSIASQSGFEKDLALGRAQRMLSALEQEVKLADDIIEDAAGSVVGGSGRASMILSNLESDFANGQEWRARMLENTLNSMGSMDTEFAKNVSRDRDGTAIHLMMAKRGVRDILDAWGQYVEVESGKFRKMADTDEQFIRISDHHIDTSTGEAGHKLESSTALLKTFGEQLENVVSDYFDFSHKTAGQVDLLANVIPLLNATAGASIKQVSENAYKFDRSDADADNSARTTSEQMIKDFEKSLDNHARMAISAANGELLPALSSGA